MFFSRGWKRCKDVEIHKRSSSLDAVTSANIPLSKESHVTKLSVKPTCCVTSGEDKTNPTTEGKRIHIPGRVGQGEYVEQQSNLPQGLAQPRGSKPGQPSCFQPEKEKGVQGNPRKIDLE